MKKDTKNVVFTFGIVTIATIVGHMYSGATNIAIASPVDMPPQTLVLETTQNKGPISVSAKSVPSQPSQNANVKVSKVATTQTVAKMISRQSRAS